MSVALATRHERFRAVENSLEKARTRIAQIIPPGTGLVPSRVVAVVLDALQRDPKLLELEPGSVVRAVIHAAEIGLELGSVLGEAYLVPFKGKATMMVGYRGFVKLIHMDPQVSMIKGVLVREADDFSVDEGNNTLHHKPGKGDTRERGEITHAYSRVYYMAGHSRFEVMDRGELDKIRNEAKSKGSCSPWNGPHADEMYKKCPLRRQAKWMNLSPLLKSGVERDDLEAFKRGEFGSLQAKGETFSSERADELKMMLQARDQKVEMTDVVDADFEDAPRS